MSSTNVPTTPAVAAPADGEARSSFSFSRKTAVIPVTPEYVEQGLRNFTQDQGCVHSLCSVDCLLNGCRTSVSAPPAGRDIRNDGGIPSSAVFASEQARDAERFAALDPEKRDQTPSVPLGFATGPSHASRPISRTASMAAEANDTTLDSPADDGDATPLILANHLDVCRVLHLTPAITKGKPETALASAARANGNITRIGAKLIATDVRIDALGLSVQNQHRALESKLNRTNPGNAGSVADIARLSDEVATVARRLDLVSGSFLCDDVGVPIANLFATQGDIHALHGSVQEALNGTDEGMAEQVRPITSDVQALTVRVAKLEADLAAKTTELLTVRENVARNSLETSALIRASNAPPAAAAAVTLSTAPANSFEFAIGKRQVKRKASVELVSAPKRAAAKYDKALFHHWVHVGPVNGDTKVAAPGVFKKLIETVFGVQAAEKFPSTFIERSAADPKTINIGFSTANNANIFVGQWAGATNMMDARLRAISVRHTAIAGSSGANDTFGYLLGN
ncbi:hypothetical protein B0H10DRAFT_2108851 [Mycena sp. CBHHK59/15]|nr:hypothetical protein B0H10DRAFT_2108851 [Mycena sp. CBHHK59/15]